MQKKLNRTSVKSRSLRSIGYDPKTQTLEIQFIRGTIYQYFGVPASTHEKLIQAPSHGWYFNQFIKQRYRYRRIR